MTAKSDRKTERRQALATAVLQESFTQASFAKEWGVAQSLISVDLRSKEFLAARNTPLAIKALRVIEYHLNQNDRQTALFVAERLRLLEPEEGATDSNAHAILERIFAPKPAPHGYTAPDESHWESEKAYLEQTGKAKDKSDD